MKIIFRPVRNCLYRAMMERKIFDSKEDFVSYAEFVAKQSGFNNPSISLKYHCYDNRIEWNNCSYVVAKEGIREKTIGYCSDDFDDDYWNLVKDMYKKFAEARNAV